MQMNKASLVPEIRAASRALVREFGLMNRTVAGTDLSLSAVHAIIEIGLAKNLSSRDLCEKLLLEKSTVSRLVNSLVNRGELLERRSREDKRIKNLQLTSQGKSTLREIDRFAETQVSSALDVLDEPSRLAVLKSFEDYTTALKIASGRLAKHDSIDDFSIETGYVPTLVGRIVEMLHAHMNRHYGFGIAFETRIAGDIAEFFGRLDSPRNQTWYAEIGGKVVGSISIDGEDLGDGNAHLRWFIVDEAARGSGAGKALLQQALSFCDQQEFPETHLWTVKGLDKARRLYEINGFELADEYYGDQWGSEVVEQKFVRKNRNLR